MICLCLQICCSLGPSWIQVFEVNTNLFLHLFIFETKSCSTQHKKMDYINLHIIAVVFGVTAFCLKLLIGIIYCFCNRPRRIKTIEQQQLQQDQELTNIQFTFHQQPPQQLQQQRQQQQQQQQSSAHSLFIVSSSISTSETDHTPSYDTVIINILDRVTNDTTISIEWNYSSDTVVGSKPNLN